MKTILSLLLLSVLVHAGPRVIGNGGNSVVCRNDSNEILSVELLDFYESRAERGIIQNLSDKNSAEENVRLLIDRIKNKAPNLGILVADLYQRFAAEAAYVENAKLVTALDSAHLFYPENCKVEQAALQRPPIIAGDKYYFINQSLWNKMRSPDRAGLIFHEILYRIYLKNYSGTADPTSVFVRYFNSMVAADLLESKSDDEILKLVSELSPEAANGLKKKSILGQVMTREEVVSGIPITFEALYTKEGTLQNKAICRFSRVGKGEDLVAMATAKARVDGESVTHLEAKVAKATSQGEKNFCVAAISIAKNNYYFLDAKTVMIADQVWTLKETDGEPVVAAPTDQSDAPNIVFGKKWLGQIVTEVGQLEILQDFTVKGLLKVEVQCHFADGLTVSKVEAPVEITGAEIINNVIKVQKTMSPTSSYFCTAIIAKRRLRYDIIDETHIRISGDPFLPNGTVLMSVTPAGSI